MAKKLYTFISSTVIFVEKLQIDTRNKKVSFSYNKWKRHAMRERVPLAKFKRKVQNLMSARQTERKYNRSKACLIFLKRGEWRRFWGVSEEGGDEVMVLDEGGKEVLGDSHGQRRDGGLHLSRTIIYCLGCHLPETLGMVCQSGSLKTNPCFL